MALSSTLWAPAFARCDLAPFRECQNNTHFARTIHTLARHELMRRKTDRTRRDKDRFFGGHQLESISPGAPRQGTFSPLAGGVFVGRRPPRRASTPCKKKKKRCTAVAMYRRSHTHTHTRTHRETETHTHTHTLTLTLTLTLTCPRCVASALQLGKCTLGNLGYLLYG